MNAALTSHLRSPFRDLPAEPGVEVGGYQESPPATEQALVRSAISGGRTGVNELTDLVFFRRHPERNGRLISRTEPDFARLSQEWLVIRDTIVLPALSGAAPRPWVPGAPTGTRPTPPAGGTAPDLSTRFENGRIPAHALCPIRTAPGKLLECTAAQAFEQLNAAFRARFGYDVSVTDAYRSYERQVELKRTEGDKAATPGTSNHGWGRALDLGGMNYGRSPVFDWFTANAAKYGWIHPTWAQPGGSNEEAWHWEFPSSR